ncbi:YodC family protein [Bernardetia sp.]|uniref:YodC family protein n=1 Tax=Bernardetia sp. TaxID=1937974 RepID=UPI0025C4279E|nr:DUF2158 domain-containing protein [Bernardetia sp.]
MEDFKIGDIVRLKSSGTPMTIEDLDVSDNTALCVWHDKKKILQSARFDVRTLVSIDEISKFGYSDDDDIPIPLI